MSTTETLLPNELHTGVDEMDAQHEALFSAMQSIKTALMTPDADLAAGMQQLLRLQADMAAHFRWEESAAAARAIPFAEHAAEHGRLLTLIDKKIAEAQNGSGNIPALLVFLDRCFEMHVTHFDQTLGQGLKTH